MFIFAERDCGQPVLKPELGGEEEEFFVNMDFLTTEGSVVEFECNSLHTIAPFFISEGVYRYNITCQPNGDWTLKEACRMYSLFHSGKWCVKIYTFKSKEPIAEHFFGQIILYQTVSCATSAKLILLLAVQFCTTRPDILHGAVTGSLQPGSTDLTLTCDSGYTAQGAPDGNPCNGIGTDTCTINGNCVFPAGRVFRTQLTCGKDTQLLLRLSSSSAYLQL